MLVDSTQPIQQVPTDFMQHPYEFLDRVRADGPAHNLVFPHGAKVWLVTRYADVRRLLSEAGAHVVAYLGDDLGDLPAFDAVDALRAEGGGGLTVASAGADAARELADRADLVLDGPDAVVAFLRDLVAAL